MKPCPQGDTLQTALQWLRLNEGRDGESDACKAVADWLEDFATDDMIRREARRAGIPVALVRKRLAAKAWSGPG